MAVRVPRPERLTLEDFPTGQWLLRLDPLRGNLLYVVVLPGGKLAYKVLTDEGVYHTEDAAQAVQFFNGERS